MPDVKQSRNQTAQERARKRAEESKVSSGHQCSSARLGLSCRGETLEIMKGELLPFKLVPGWHTLFIHRGDIKLVG